MHEVTITGLTRASNAKPNKGGSTVLAYFDCAIGAFALNGCAFVRSPNRSLTVWPPKLDGPESTRRAVIIRDDRLRHDMMRAAQNAYRALGGTDGEWMSDPIYPVPSVANVANVATVAMSQPPEARECSQEEPADAEGDEGLRRYLSA